MCVCVCIVFIFLLLFLVVITSSLAQYAVNALCTEGIPYLFDDKNSQFMTEYLCEVRVCVFVALASTRARAECVLHSTQ